VASSAPLIVRSASERQEGDDGLREPFHSDTTAPLPLGFPIRRCDALAVDRGIY
jgi:hypothetical protein